MRYLLFLISSIILIACTDEFSGQAGDRQHEPGPATSQPINAVQFQNVDPNQLIRFAEKSSIETDELFSIGDTRLTDDRDAIEERKNYLYRVLNALESTSHNGEPDADHMEAAFVARIQLSALHERMAGQTEDREIKNGLIRDAITYQKAALNDLDRLIEINEEYAVDRAFPEVELATMNCYLITDRNCLETLRSIIEKYDASPYGPYPEWFVSHTAIPAFYQYAEQSGQTDLVRYAMDELYELSARPDAIGASASIMLIRHFISHEQYGSAERLMERTTFSIQDLPDDIRTQWQTIETVYENVRERQKQE